MSKLMDRLAKLEYFTKKQADFEARKAGLEAEMRAASKEFDEFMEKEMGIKGNITLSALMTKVLETSFEPVSN
jgi:hypothetical protein